MKRQSEKILHNSYNNIEYAKERTMKGATISVDLDAYNLYEEATTDDISGTIMRNKLNETLYDEFRVSPWSEKYQNSKKVEKSDLSDLYYYFRDILVDKHHHGEVETFCAIAEFFELNYSVLYKEILTIDSKLKILKGLKETYGLSKALGSRTCRLF